MGTLSKILKNITQVDLGPPPPRRSKVPTPLPSLDYSVLEKMFHEECLTPKMKEMWTVLNTPPVPPQVQQMGQAVVQAGIAGSRTETYSATRFEPFEGWVTRHGSVCDLSYILLDPDTLYFDEFTKVVDVSLARAPGCIPLVVDLQQRTIGRYEFQHQPGEPLGMISQPYEMVAGTQMPTGFFATLDLQTPYVRAILLRLAWVQKLVQDVIWALSPLTMLPLATVAAVAEKPEFMSLRDPIVVNKGATRTLIFQHLRDLGFGKDRIELALGTVEVYRSLVALLKLGVEKSYAKLQDGAHPFIFSLQTGLTLQDIERLIEQHKVERPTPPDFLARWLAP